ncbi:DUF481 domain-containing protein [Sulfurimonas sp.]|uniref:DUF481 domain-containing protein n=1 Tax=Sulfurimonas sp. TaxID=2022749 RepID=UPI002B47AE8C|nr:DUF481 domain-containing protein [Sulfurimonas sp.]
MKKIVLSLLVVNSLIMANQLQDDISVAKAEAKTANDKVKELEAKLPPNEKLMTHTELGFIKTDGNTKTKTFILEVKAKKGWDKHLLSILFDGQYAQDNNIESKNKFFTELGYGYSFTDRLSGTYLIGYKQDKFSGFDYQAYTGPGIKYLAIKTDAHNLNLGGSLLYSEDNVEDTNYDASGNVITYPNANNIATTNTTRGMINKYGSYRAKGVYTWQVLTNLSFYQELTYRAEFKDSSVYFAYSKTALSSKISDMFSASISYKADYVNSPPTGKKNTDTTFTANLVIDY